MATSAFQREEKIGLGTALAVHVALVAILMLRSTTGDVVVPPERIEVTLSDEVGLTSTSPSPSRDAAPDLAPTIGEMVEAAPEIIEAAPAPVPPVAAPEPEPAPRPSPRPAPAPSPRPSPKPSPSPAPRPSPAPSPSPAPRPAPKPKQEAPAKKEAPRPTPPRKADPKPAEKSGGSRVGADFLEGVSNSSTGRSSSAAATFGAREQASLASAISRQLRPHWSAPQGADAELLVTRLRFRLNRDGTLAGEPEVLSTTGRTDTNAPQVQRHQEQAVRAVKLAAPFDLPPQFYDHWRTITSNFDRNLSR